MINLLFYRNNKQDLKTPIDDYFPKDKVSLKHQLWDNKHSKWLLFTNVTLWSNRRFQSFAYHKLTLRRRQEIKFPSLPKDNRGLIKFSNSLLICHGTVYHLGNRTQTISIYVKLVNLDQSKDFSPWSFFFFLVKLLWS